SPPAASPPSSPQVYGQGSGPECRHHVQKLNLLQGEAEEALGWTSWYSVYLFISFTEASQTSEVSRWSKYLDREREDQEDGEEEAAPERQQFCSQRRNTGGEQRKHQKSFLSSDGPEHAEENGVFQPVYQAKKFKTTEKHCAAVAGGVDRDAVSGGSVIPATCEPVVPEDNTQPPTACAKPSKWGKFLSSSGNSSENTAGVTLSLQGRGGLGLDSTAAAGASGAGRCSEQAGRTLPQGTAFELRKCGASTEGLASKLPGAVVPSTSSSVEQLFREPQSQLVRAGSGTETTAGWCCLGNTKRANTLVNSNPGPKLSSISCEQLFSTGEEFDDDL
ncbi:MRNIP protein, partial [Xiphorhynchus elegans]|nr:MRNIP protein [Xiphorhynchus elegans]